MSEGNAAVRLPLLVGLGIIDEEDEILVVALEVDLGLRSFSANHCC